MSNLHKYLEAGTSISFTLGGFYNEMERQLKSKIVGKTVRVTDAATSDTEDMEEYEGEVTNLRLGSFGYEGEGLCIVEFADGKDIMLDMTSIMTIVPKKLKI